MEFSKNWDYNSSKKLFFNLKNKESNCSSQSDLRKDDVKNIAKTLVSEEEVVSMNRRLSGKEQSLNSPREDGDEWRWVIDNQMDQS